MFQVNNKDSKIRKVNDKVKNKGTVDVVLASLLLTFNTFHLLLQQLYWKKIAQRHLLKLKNIWNYKELLGLVINTITKLNSLFSLFPVQQKFFQKSTLGGLVATQLPDSFAF